MYLLDSNVCIRLLNESASSNMARKLAELTQLKPPGVPTHKLVSPESPVLIAIALTRFAPKPLYMDVEFIGYLPAIILTHQAE